MLRFSICINTVNHYQYPHLFNYNTLIYQNGQILNMLTVFSKFGLLCQKSLSFFFRPSSLETLLQAEFTLIYAFLQKSVKNQISLSLSSKVFFISLTSFVLDSHVIKKLRNPDIISVSGLASYLLKSYRPLHTPTL